MDLKIPLFGDIMEEISYFLISLFGWGGFGLMDLDLRAQIQILCLDDLKSLGFRFGSYSSRILKAQIHGFQMTS
jgi:hypothetical protein